VRDTRDYLRDAPASTRDYLRHLRWALDWERDAFGGAAGAPPGSIDPPGTLAPTAADDHARLIHAARALRTRMRAETAGGAA
jgi:hypothetical protein